MPALLPSELPVRARAWHHWIVLFKLPGKVGLIALAVFVVLAFVDPSPFAWLLGIGLVVTGFLRYRTWQAEQIILTTKRIIRVQGLPETTRSEASLRVDRIAGARLVETVWGKLLGYGTIELEAPGDHADVRYLVTIANPHEFYLILRDVIFGEPFGPDPDDGDDDGDGGYYVTEPLPHLGSRRDDSPNRPDPNRQDPNRQDPRRQDPRRQDPRRTSRARPRGEDPSGRRGRRTWSARFDDE